MALSRAELFAAIRRDVRDGLSNRQIQRKHGVGFRTVKEAMASAWPTERKDYTPRGSKIEPFATFIDEILVADLTAPRKQKHTLTRIYQRLIDECGMSGVSYSVLGRYVRERKPQILAEHGRGPANVFIPQTHRPGEEAEVDFGDIAVWLRGELVTCYLFCFRMSFSGKAVHRASLSAGQEAFFEGHLHAVRVLGGVPSGKVRYDNLRSAVAQVLGFTRARVEAERWTVFRSHLGLEPFYCKPGIEGAHEKGGVEGQVGWFRRNHLVPVPEVNSITELNEMIDAWDAADDDRRIGSRPRTIGEMFAAEKPLLLPLPTEEFETGRWFTLRVDRYSQISVRTNKYSVPVRFIGRSVRVLLHASELVVYDGQTEIARHERLCAKGGTRLELDHYLEGLLRKPGALPGATALEQARAAGKFTPIHEAWWAAARKAHGDQHGTRALIEVLLLQRNLSHDLLVDALAAALQSGALTADAVALEARKIQESQPATPGPIDLDEPPVEAVTSLTARRLAQLPRDNRPLPTVDHYDQLLRLPRTQKGSS
ncbi:IS21 family transposase [Nocardia farcinica]|uniref:IS21 family transposase n=1 Tax=Nocardia farcinica TaxID=37329 RepID=UPI001894BDBF|nr:IS21 family transposase [Nocardia farcinica]MBF6185065.1 IS21 family transposase [Nocardia farcinica]MBF6363967.1 IS21 family transposase [Nocardia farcinica]